MNAVGRTRSVPFRSMPNPFAVASALAEPSRADRVDDPVVRALQWARTAVGVAATVWLLMAYPLKEGREKFVMGKLEDLLIGCGITFATAFVAVTVFIAAARSPLGRVYARRLPGPLLTVCAIPLSVGVCWFLIELLKGEIISLSDFDYHGILFSILLIVVFFVGALACAAALLLAVPVTVAALVYGFNSCFRLGDVHDLLPALISPLLVWSLFGLGLFDDPEVAAPPLVLYTFLLGGPLSVTLLSVWEVRRLRRRHGVTLRSALGR
ncbi:hypothetical protein OG562_15945 [Streptomyces sp. NBC_01275]|uniref:hypothetical protein n=1 Tax=Streptomyces sp. NBC_01275 TaxID=2903807 RepID=UPI0022513C8E|nr:hypothetical protein [Streptomyces sp. NBC_01275]MCX4762442.1 hypothetical protein [Streptomyces sp. NBC_01275]